MATNRELSREDEAMTVLARTEASPATQRLLILPFAAIVWSVLLLQPLLMALGVREQRRATTYQPVGIRMGVPRPQASRGLPSIRGFWEGIPSEARLRRYEERIEDQSAFGLWLRPRAQALVARVLAAGTARVVLGREGWLYYRQDADYVVARPFLSADRLAVRSRAGAGEVQPDPVASIAQFGELLKRRGIHLLVLPVPVKPTIYPEYLSEVAKAPLNNPSYPGFLRALAAAGVHTVDLVPALIKAKDDGPLLYAPRDTHWTGAGIRVGAEVTAAAIRATLTIDSTRTFRMGARTIEHGSDLDSMLQAPLPAHKLDCGSVEAANGEPFRPTIGAPVLVLGDSFAIECSEGGSGGGLAAELARMLGTDVDLLAGPGWGDQEARAALLKDTRRLHQTKVVVLEFVARELAFGNWR